MGNDLAPRNQAGTRQRRHYISDVEISGVSEAASLGVGEPEGFDDAVVRQSLPLDCGDAEV